MILLLGPALRSPLQPSGAPGRVYAGDLPRKEHGTPEPVSVPPAGSHAAPPEQTEGEAQDSAPLAPPAAASAPPAASAPLEAGAPRSLRVGRAELQLELDSAEFAVSRERIVQWVASSAEIVRRYYGAFPAERVRVVIVQRPGRRVGPGRTYGPGWPLIRLGLGREATAVDLERDWVLVHELVHLAFPILSQEHAWLTEGLATYVEPVARAQAGQLSAAQVWERLLDGLPRGLPQEGDLGLDFTPTWGRTYWGGALFCLQADVEIRRRTDNRFGLQDALRAVVAQGGSFAVRWPIERALAVGDEAVGVSVLSELYEQLRAAPVAPDLAALGGELGVALSAERAQFDDAAPLAGARQSITAAPREE